MKCLIHGSHTARSHEYINQLDVLHVCRGDGLIRLSIIPRSGGVTSAMLAE